MAAVALLAAAVLARAQAQPAAVDPRFGAIEAFWEPAAAADLGVGWDRILFLWHEVQPTGPQDWNTLHVLEEWLVDAQANGRTVVGLLKSTPPWAASPPWPVSTSWAVSPPCVCAVSCAPAAATSPPCSTLNGSVTFTRNECHGVCGSAGLSSG